MRPHGKAGFLASTSLPFFSQTVPLLAVPLQGTNGWLRLPHLPWSLEEQLQAVQARRQEAARQAEPERVLLADAVSTACPVVLLHSPPTSAGLSIGMQRGCPTAAE